MIINVNDYKQVLKKYIFNQKWKSIVDAINDDPTSEFYKTYIDQNKLNNMYTVLGRSTQSIS